MRAAQQATATVQGKVIGNIFSHMYLITACHMELVLANVFQSIT